MTTVSDTTLSPGRWWQAAGEGRLLILRCPVCDSSWLPWMPHCPECGRGPTPDVVESTGRGTIYSWVGVRSSISSPDEAPFVVASVKLDEGAMIYGRLRDEPVADGQVEAVFVERGDRTTIDFAAVESD
jgi:uncharacterized OB-fold protein